MRCSNRSVAVVSLLFAVLLSLSIGTLNARDADLASRIFAAAQTAKQQHKHLSCTLSRLSSSEPVAIVRVSECLPGLHPIHLYWFRTRMTDVSFAAVSGDASARPIQALLTRTRFRAKAATFEIAKLQFDRPGGG